jgi:hypothetical protein
VTEAEWLVCTDPTPMLEFVEVTTSKRKLRLVTVAAARSAWSRIPEEVRPAVEAAERCADGQADPAELHRYRPGSHGHLLPGRGWSELREEDRIQTYGLVQALSTCCPRDRLAELSRRMFWMGAATRSGVPLSSILREVLGNPFRRIVPPAGWCAMSTLATAKAIYADRAYDRLPILADALEDAGCDNADLLTHLRGDGPHVRGCWAVDLILGNS